MKLRGFVFVYITSVLWFLSLTLTEEYRLLVEEVTVNLRNLHPEEFYGLYSSPNIIWVIKSRRIGWAGYVACMEEGRGEAHTEFWW